MSRVHKYRAWQRAHAQMIEWAQLKNTTLWDALDGMQLMPMQFTGIKDKNCIDIYEDDLLRIKYEDDDLEQVLPVIWLCCGFLVNWPNGIGCYTDISDLCDNCDVEIIGNIHQNPELLEETP